MPRSAKRHRASSAPALQALPPRRTDRLRGDVVIVTSLRRLHAAQGVLHRALAADRPSPAGRASTTTGSTVFLGGYARCWRCRAAARSPTAGTATSSTTGTSSTPCAASRWRCSTWSTATSCSRAGLPRAFEALLAERLPERRLPDHGRAARPRPRARLRGGARRRPRGRARRRPPARPGGAARPASRPIPPRMPEVAVELRRRCSATRSSAPSLARGTRHDRRPIPIDAARLALMLNDLRLPAIKLSGRSSPTVPIRRAGRPPASSPPWPSTRSPSAPAAASSATRRGPVCRPARPWTPSTSQPCRWSARPRSPPSPPVTLAGQGRQPAAFGPPGGGKVAPGRRPRPRPGRERLARAVHPHHRPGAAAAGRATRLTLEAAIAKLDKYHLLILDDLAYVTKDQAETSVLFELIADRHP